MVFMAILNLRKCPAVVALMLLLGSTAHAMSWSKIGDSEGVTLYVNRNAVEKEDAIRRVWEMQDLQKADADGVVSRRYLNEYDCQNKMFRLSKMDSFSGPKLSGRKLFTVEEPGYWRKITPNGLFTLSYIWLCVK